MRNQKDDKMEKIELENAITQFCNAGNLVKKALKTATMAVDGYDKQAIINQFEDEFEQLAGFLQWLQDTGGENAFE